MSEGTLKGISREMLEEICLLALNREHIATHRANELEDRINKAIEFCIEKERIDASFNENPLIDYLIQILKGVEHE